MDILLVFFTGILTLLTGFLAKYTQQLAREEAIKREPDIIVSIESDKECPAILNFVIENIGGGLAKDIEISINKDIGFIGEGSYLNNQPFLKQNYLKPKSMLEKRLNAYHKLQDDKTVEFQVKFFDSKKKNEFNNCFKYDLQSFSGLAAHSSEVVNGARAIVNIEKLIKSIIQGSSRVNIDSFDSKDREAEFEKRKEAFEAFKKRKAEINANQELI